MSASRSYLIVVATLAAIAFLPGLLGWNPSVVQSASMEPHVSTGDVVLAEALPATDPVPVGGVITFRVEGTHVVHRVVSVNEDNTLVTAGDANHDVDPWSITREDITGRARLLVPFIGLPGLWMQRGDLLPLGAWLLATLSAVGLALPPRAPRRATLPPETLASPDVSDAPSARPGAPVSLLGSAVALVGVVALTATVLPLPPVEAAFTGSTRAASVWKAKSYAPITVGALSGYGALAASAVRDTDSHWYQSSVDGAIGTTPGTTISGFRNRDADSFNFNNASARNAMAAASALRTALLERPVTRSIPAALGGTLGPGVYTSTSGAFSLGGTITLDAAGDPSARFIFRTTTALTMAQRARVVLARGAQAANVYWIVGTTATLGTQTSYTPDTTAIGTYLVAGDVTLRGVALTGRAVSFGGTVLLNGRIVPTN